MKITLGYSPCPNDTVVFYRLAKGLLGLPGHEIDAQLHDVETLNRFAMSGVPDITKLSFHAWLNVKDKYRTFKSGAALG